MQEPLQISFHNMESSDGLERRVREHWAKVERHYDGIISARIVIEASGNCTARMPEGIPWNVEVLLVTWFSASNITSAFIRLG